MDNFFLEVKNHKKDPLTLFYKMQKIIQEKNTEIEELKSKINFMNLPLKSDIVYQSSFYFNIPIVHKVEFSTFITLTFDHSFFLPKNEGDQVNFFINLLYETFKMYTHMFGVFEHHKTGIIHFHGVFKFENNDRLNMCLIHFRNKLTNKSKHAVNVKDITDLDKLLTDYLAKEKFISIEKKNI